MSMTDHRLSSAQPRDGARSERGASSLDASVVICTFRRPALLNACLESLSTQRNPFGSIEILVVDNCQNREAEPVVQRHRSGFAERGIALRYLVESNTGVAFARNRGIAEAAHPVICFIDDDEQALDGWLETLLQPFDALGAGVDIVAGEVEPDFADNLRPEWLSDDMLHIFSCKWGWDVNPRFLGPKEWFGEGNCAFRKSLFAHSRFPTDLGRSGGNLMSSEGIVFVELRRAGARAYFSPDAKVTHHVHAERLNKPWALRRMFFQGISDFMAHKFLGVRQDVPDININLQKLSGLNTDAMERGEFIKTLNCYYYAGYSFSSAMN